MGIENFGLRVVIALAQAAMRAYHMVLAKESAVGVAAVLAAAVEVHEQLEHGGLGWSSKRLEGAAQAMVRVGCARGLGLQGAQALAAHPVLFLAQGCLQPAGTEVALVLAKDLEQRRFPGG